MNGKTLLSLAVIACTTTAAQAAPEAATNSVLPATERPYTAQQADLPHKRVTYGLCSGPQNADDLPTSPVPVQEDRCSHYQHYEAVSAAPSHGGSCGGYAVAFGPMGDLKTDWKRYTLKALYGEALTEAQCSKARIATVAWGSRCLNDDCSSVRWERIGTPRAKNGSWSGQGRCNLEHSFVDVQHRYKVLNIDVIATLQEGSQTVRKRARASIRAERGNGKCYSTTQPASRTPVQAASQAGATHAPQRQP